MAALEQIDALLTFVTWSELVSDVAVLLFLLALLSAGLSGVAWLASIAAKAVGLQVSTQRHLAWALVCLPIAILCIGQLGFVVKQWIEHTTHLKLTTGVPHKGAVVLLPVVLTALLWRWIGTARLIRRVTEPLLALRVATLIVFAVAVAHASWHSLMPSRIGAQSPATGERASPRPPDVFVFSLDSLAAQDAGLCHDGPAIMPRLRQLAARSACFSRHYAVSTLTRPATTSIETGVLPWTHWVIHSSRVPSPLVDASIGRALQKAGYSAHMVSAVASASPLSHGTHRGYDATPLTPSSAWHVKLNHLLHRLPDARSLPNFFSATSIALSFADLYRLPDQSAYPSEDTYAIAHSLVTQAPADRPLFLWAHTWPPHTPYLPPRSTKYKLLPAGEFDDWHSPFDQLTRYPATQQHLVNKQRLRYRESIMGADETLGDFLDALERAGRLDQALVIVTSDHGESFEQGFLGHGGESLHEAVIRVPLLIKLPGQRVARKIDTPVSQIDIAPTILDLVGAAPLPLAEGRSLRAALSGNALPATPVVSMTIDRESRFRPIQGGLYAVIEEPYKFIYQPKLQKSALYNLTTDPGEMRDLSSQEPEVAARLLAVIRSRIDNAESRRQHLAGTTPLAGR